MSERSTTKALPASCIASDETVRPPRPRLVRALAADWTAMLTDHATAVGEFVAGRPALPGRGLVPGALAPAKWSPSEIASHVIEAYEVLGRELNGGRGKVLRHTILTGMLRGRPFPAGARPPRETRPRELHADPDSALAALGIARSPGYAARRLTDGRG
jgi:hypothetical protein